MCEPTVQAIQHDGQQLSINIQKWSRFFQKLGISMNLGCSNANVKTRPLQTKPGQLSLTSCMWPICSMHWASFRKATRRSSKACSRCSWPKDGFLGHFSWAPFLWMCSNNLNHTTWKKKHHIIWWNQQRRKRLCFVVATSCNIYGFCVSQSAANSMCISVLEIFRPS